jgi:hypothetical protein
MILQSRTTLSPSSYPNVQFIPQCRLKILIETHLFTCASYDPFESLHIDRIGPLPSHDKGNTHILVMIDAFSRWVELFTTKTTVRRVHLPALRSIRNPDVIHTDQGPAFRNELFPELSRLFMVKHSFATARRTVSSNARMRKSCAIYVPCFSKHAYTTSGLTSSYPWYNVS